MATVPANCGFADVFSVFGGSGSFADYYRGGPIVPNIGANAAIADNPGSLELAQFPGSTNYVPLSASANGASSSGSQKGTYTIGSSTCSIGGGNGNVSYRLDWIGGDTNFPSTVSGNRATFTVTNTTINTTHKSGTYRWTVTDGISTATADFTVSWN
ncbi:hypothetical protein [Luteibacter sp. 22Crub2.1]|uniref:hypothetical protein n=1 Tax=Luteibacter sp. 22Crub2.1 TaxID=1283288 RepID=UPI0009A68004|nr:hypothetical protein [Luteibacter sp. 22Crub2.1]SKB50792.1 hypothetical protein SAMN05660880_01375 [Luteibacter sp. 22Crub2.1]